MPKQSSPELSSRAAKVVRMTNAQLASLMVRTEESFCNLIRSLAASVLSQDETKGQGEEKRRRKPAPAQRLRDDRVRWG